MDHNLTQDKIEKLHDELADLMIEGMATGKITDEEATNSAKFILETLDKVKTQEELMKYLQDLSNKWSVY